jgi:hypothetical protein
VSQYASALDRRYFLGNFRFLDRSVFFPQISGIDYASPETTSRLWTSGITSRQTNGNSLGSDRRGSFQRPALPPTGYSPTGILNLGCCHSRSYDPQSVVVVSSRSCSDTGPGIRTYVVSWNASTAQVKVTESTLSSDIALVCSSFEPHHCLALIMWHSDTVDMA